MTKASLLTVARQQARIARYSATGHSVRRIARQEYGPVRHEVVCLLSGATVCVATAPERGVTLGPGATIQVLQGSVRVLVGNDVVFGWPGDLLFIDDPQSEVRAAQDATLLITSALAQRTERPASSC